MANRARALVAKADQGELILVIIPLVLAETFFTLESFYQMDRTVVATKLLALLNCRGIEVLEKEELLDAVERCRTAQAHFTDSFLASVAVRSGNSIASFDRDFDSFARVRRVEPK
jgi:predicted nucleic acid-binding protein